MQPFRSILRQPDHVLVMTDASGVRFEEDPQDGSAAIGFLVEDGCARITLTPTAVPVKRVKLRWQADLAHVRAVLGDDWERSATLGFACMQPEKAYPWYVHVFDGECLAGYGVKTGPNAFCSWQLDDRGLSLWLDVRCGGAGVALEEPLEVASVVERPGIPGEAPFDAARAFARRMCPNPVLPKAPVYGANNWYWAYGMISHEDTVRETEYLLEMTLDAGGTPFMVIDDGWQDARYRGLRAGYNGGPWYRSNACFAGGMQRTAEEIAALGATPGLWFRPLLTCARLPAGVELARPGMAGEGQVMDPSLAYTLDRVREDTARIAGWGYGMLKHDFSAIDALGGPTAPDGWHFADRSLTGAQVMKRLYKTIQAAAGGALVIGCNTFGHLAAGIHAIQRTGDDTSGRSFEWTRRAGVNNFLRLPQNGAFFQIDPDCAAFTDRVPHGLNLDFMEACAITGSALFASVTPGCLDADAMRRIREIYRMAALPEDGAQPVDWMHTRAPARFLHQGRERRFDWYAGYHGARMHLTWMG